MIELVYCEKTKIRNKVKISDRRMLRMLGGVSRGPKCSLLNFEGEVQEIKDFQEIISQKGVKNKINLDCGLVSTHI